MSMVSILFDEFDTIDVDRSMDNDVGDLDKVFAL